MRFVATAFCHFWPRVGRLSHAISGGKSRGCARVDRKAWHTTGARKSLTLRKCHMLKSVFTILPLLLLPLLLENAWAQTASPEPQSSPLPPLIILIGPPLSGKTTLVDSITKTYNVPNISIEDLIKDNAAELEHLRAQGTSMAECATTKRPGSAFLPMKTFAASNPAGPPPVWQVTAKPVLLEARAEACTIFLSIAERRAESQPWRTDAKPEATMLGCPKPIRKRDP